MRSKQPPNARARAKEFYAPGGLRDRLRAIPRCGTCGCINPIAPGTDDDELVECLGCGRKALPESYREWGAIADRAIGGLYDYGSWESGTLTIREAGLSDRVVARIDVPERTAIVEPIERGLADILSSFDLAVREGEVAA
jgi:hypothetical protein